SAPTTSAATKTATPAWKQETLLEGRRIEPGTDVREIARGRVASGTPPGAVEIGGAGLRIAGEHILDLECGPQGVEEFPVEGMREIFDLSLRQLSGGRGLGRVAVLKEWPDRATVAVVQNDFGTDQIGPAVAASCVCTVARDAFG